MEGDCNEVWYWEIHQGVCCTSFVNTILHGLLPSATASTWSKHIDPLPASCNTKVLVRLSESPLPPRYCKVPLAQLLQKPLLGISYIDMHPCFGGTFNHRLLSLRLLRVHKIPPTGRPRGWSSVSLTIRQFLSLEFTCLFCMSGANLISCLKMTVLS